MNKDFLENLKLIHEEIICAREQQLKDVELIYNKFNWILVTNIVLLGFLLSLKDKDIFIFLAFIFLIGSSLLSLISLKLKTFKRGPLLCKLIDAEKKSEDQLLRALNKKIHQDIEKNKDLVKNFGDYLKYSIYLLMLALLCVFCYIFNLILIIQDLIYNLLLCICKTIN